MNTIQTLVAAMAVLVLVGLMAVWIYAHPDQPAYLDQHATDCNNHLTAYNAAAQQYNQDKSSLGASIDNYLSGKTQQAADAANTEANYLDANCGYSNPSS